ncbi:MAG: flagellar filament capping protein FliD [Pseudomonas sp.]|uniref:flagellar filament capping protein FliD n=1 Tax=Pseudomonas abieticivorans TaxID=2931382 RepID=UPI00209727C7|nr:flagellar filament capping protein FliD [Pseudomonas sp. PIA16]MDE1168411.1 flagellar filament capping protein FliD [Pseudomonas sp.]
MTTTTSTTSTSSSGTITSLGVGSGLDLDTILDSLEESAEASYLTPIETKEDEINTEITAYGTLTSALTSLQTAIETLTDPDTYDGMTSSVSGTGATAAVTSDAVAGTYTVVVSQLAAAQTLATDGVADKTTALGTGTLTIDIGDDESISIDLTSSNNTLEGIRDAINDAGGSVTASIVNDGSDTPYRLVLTSTSTGTESAMTVTYSGDGDAASLFGYDADSDSNAMTETVAAADAQLTVNGLSVTSQSNTVEEALQGVTLSLTAEGTSTLTVSQDTDSIIDAINDFVDAYNSYAETIDTLTAYDSEDDTAGTLIGDSTTRRIDSQLSQDLYNSISSGTYSYLSQLGVTLGVDGTLSIDDDDLEEAVTSDPSAVSEFFIGTDDVEGFATQMAADLDTYLDEDDGLIVSKTDGLETQLEELEVKYEEKQAFIDSMMDRYTEQFTALDTLIATLDSTADYLTTQFDALSSDS